MFLNNLSDSSSFKIVNLKSLILWTHVRKRVNISRFITFYHNKLTHTNTLLNTQAKRISISIIMVILGGSWSTATSTSKARTRRAAEVLSGQKGFTIGYNRSEKQVCLYELDWSIKASELISECVLAFNQTLRSILLASSNLLLRLLSSSDH